MAVPPEYLVVATKSGEAHEEEPHESLKKQKLADGKEAGTVGRPGWLCKAPPPPAENVTQDGFLKDFFGTPPEECTRHGFWKGSQGQGSQPYKHKENKKGMDMGIDSDVGDHKVADKDGQNNQDNDKGDHKDSDEPETQVYEGQFADSQFYQP